jgi:fatty-acyl-CoA synthase
MNDLQQKYENIVEKILESKSDKFSDLMTLVNLNPQTDLEGADLQHTNLKGVNLKNCNLNGANLKNADISESNLEGASFINSDLSGANLEGAYLKNADLSGANLFGANLKYADLKDTKLFRAILKQINLSGANLSELNCKSTQFIDCKYCDRQVDEVFPIFSERAPFHIYDDEDIFTYGKDIPTYNKLPLVPGFFKTLTEALEYAARGNTGCIFYNGRGEFDHALYYRTLMEDAFSIASRFISLNLERGSRVAIVAETGADFLRFFFACQYAGMVAVALPATIGVRGCKAHVPYIRRLLLNCMAEVVIAPNMFFSFIKESAEGLPLKFIGTPSQFYTIEKSTSKPIATGPNEMACIMYTSGNTRFPRGVMMTQNNLLDNIGKILRHGIKVRPGDRCMSWLPFYHDMGLVGGVLAPMASQVSVDFLKPRDFGMRPRLWLQLISSNRATVSFAPPFGYELCAKRLREDTASLFCLDDWRIAGVGAENIRFEPLAKFAEMLNPSGFNPHAFLACYGLTECSLAVSFSAVDAGIETDIVDAGLFAEKNQAVPVIADKFERSKIKSLVKCGIPMPGFDVEIRNHEGQVLPERHLGTLFVRGPSVMAGYFREEALTCEVLSPDGWLNTGDLAYLANENLIITGRQKDLLIINGRNIWPQDLEYIAESQPDVRTGDVAAFSVKSYDGEEKAVVVIEFREANLSRRHKLISEIQTSILKDLGIECLIELVSRNTVPRTTSGKVSRSAAKKDYLRRVEDGITELPGQQDLASSWEIPGAA